MFTTGGERETFVGIASPRDVCNGLAHQRAPVSLDAVYRDARPQAGAAGTSDPLEQVIEVLGRWGDSFSTATSQVEESVVAKVGRGELQRWLGADLDTHAVSDGALTPQWQYSVIEHNERYVATTSSQNRLQKVVDRHGLVAAAALARRVGRRG